MMRLIMLPAMLALFVGALAAMHAPAPAHADSVRLLQDEDEATENEERLLFSDSFDATGDLSLWSGDKSLTVKDDLGIGGGFAARGTSNGKPSYASSRIRSPSTDVFVRIRFRIMEQGNNQIALLRLRTVAGDPVLTLFVSPTGALGYHVNVSDRTVESIAVIAHETWHEVQVHARVAGNDSEVAVWLDEQAAPDLNQSLGLGSDTIGRIDLGDNSAGRTFDVLFDDVIADSSYIAPTQQPDPITGTLVVRAYPNIAGLTFSLDGKSYTTGELGVATIDVERWTPDLLNQIEVPATAITLDGVEVVASFGSWDDWTGVRNQEVNAFFVINYPMTLSFTDSEGNSVSWREITSLKLKSSAGTMHTYSSEQLAQPLSLPGARATSTLQSQPMEQVKYSVQEVIVRGSNMSVVSRGQKEFQPGPIGSFEIELLMFSVTISARDALFGGSTGSGVEIEFPDGFTQYKQFGPDQTVTLNSLPRGEYQVSVSGGGFSPPRPLTLSRANQTLELEVVTKLDLAIVFGLVGAFGFGLLFAGRPGLLTWPFRFFRRQVMRAPQET